MRHSVENVRHGAKNVRPIKVGTDVSNSLGTVGRDDTNSMCPHDNSNTSFCSSSLSSGTRVGSGHTSAAGYPCRLKKTKVCLESSKDFGELLY